MNSLPQLQYRKVEFENIAIAIVNHNFRSNRTRVLLRSTHVTNFNRTAQLLEDLNSDYNFFLKKKKKIDRTSIIHEQIVSRFDKTKKHVYTRSQQGNSLRSSRLNDTVTKKD